MLQPAEMPFYAWPPPVPVRARRPLAALLLLAALAAVCAGLVVTHGREAGKVCHPSLSHLAGADGREVLLIGTLSLDLDGASGSLVRSALGALMPDVVMIEGTWTAGVNAMLLSGKWELHGGPPAPGSFNWTDTGDAGPVELPRPKRRGFLGAGPPPRWPERSLVPVKVGNWAHHLRGSVGGDVAAAVTVAAASGVPVRFLGPQDGGFQGHVQVSLLAQQAAMELLEEEQQRGQQLAPADVDAALLRAESHVRDEAGKWLQDVRGETSRLTEHLRDRVPAKVRRTLAERMDMRTRGMAESISKAMESRRRGAVVLAMDQLVAVEGRLKEAGYSYLSECA